MLVECSLISFLFSFSSIFLFRFQKKRESGVGSEVSDPFSVSPPQQMALEEVGLLWLWRLPGQSEGWPFPQLFLSFFPFFFVSGSPPLPRLPLVPCFCLIRLELACSLPSTGAQKSHCAVAGTAESTHSMEIAKIETCCKHSS